MLTSGQFKSIRGLAAREGADDSYVGRMLNLTTLAPDIVAAILDDSVPAHVTPYDLAINPPVLLQSLRKSPRKPNPAGIAEERSRMN